jgi:hypothetical protein
MTTETVSNTEYLHDAEVYEFRLSIDESGNRKLQLKVRCDPECGYEIWNDRHLCIEFVDPFIVHGDLFGHMANAETLNSFDFESTSRMSVSIAKMTESGLSTPKHIVSMNFHSGSNLEVACQELNILLAE